MQNQQKKQINISAMKAHQTSIKWQYLTCIKVSFSNKNLKNDIVTSRL